MKRTWIVLFAALLFSLVGCTGNVVTPTEISTAPQISIPTEAPTESPTQPTEETVLPTEVTEPTTEVISSAPIAMILSPVQEDETAANGTVVYSFRYQDIKLLLSREKDVHARIQNSMNALISYTKAQTKAAAAWAAENYTGAGDWSSYYTNLFFTPHRMDETVISISAQTMDYNGGSHPNCTVISMNFDGVNGRELCISEVITHESQLQTLHSMVTEYLTGENGPRQLLDDYENVVMERFNTASATSANWYLSQEGLVYFFSPYEIASYRDGIVEVVLPYEALSGILKEEYLPVGTHGNEYSIEAELTANVSTEFARTYTIIHEEEGDCITLYGLENAGAVNISVGYWGIDDNRFYPTETLFSGKDLTEQDCIEIHTYIPDTIPNIRIKIGDTEQKTLYLSQSGMDGSILLLEEGSF